MYLKGDILLPRDRVKRNNWLNGLFHPAIVWNENYDGYTDFNGIMITHSPHSEIFDNILMDSSHFETNHQIQFSNTHFVNQLFVKFHMWGDFELVGRLTANGISFIENNLTEVQSVEFIKYKESLVG